MQKREVTVDEFAARPIEFFEEVTRTQEEIVIVRDGKPLARVVPVPQRPTMTLEELRSRGVRVLGDIVEPIDWNAID